MFGRIMYGTVKYGNKTRVYSLLAFFQLVLQKTRGVLHEMRITGRARAYKNYSRIIH